MTRGREPRPKPKLGAKLRKQRASGRKMNSLEVAWKRGGGAAAVSDLRQHDPDPGVLGNFQEQTVGLPVSKSVIGTEWKEEASETGNQLRDGRGPRRGWWEWREGRGIIHPRDLLGGRVNRTSWWITAGGGRKRGESMRNGIYRAWEVGPSHSLN